jgi:hypothetical protein
MCVFLQAYGTFKYGIYDPPAGKDRIKQTNPAVLFALPFPCEKSRWFANTSSGQTEGDTTFQLQKDVRPFPSWQNDRF